MDNLIDSKQNKQKILEEFLKICALDGCSVESLKKSLKNCNIDENLHQLIFENGLLDLIDFYIDSYNQKILKIINKNYPDFLKLKIRQKIKIASFVRFEIESENKIAIQRIINFCLDPKNFINCEYNFRPLSLGLKINYKIADFIWSMIGDKSTDFNFYTKRLTLSKILLRTLFVFLKDDASDLKTTSDFLDNQIKKVMEFEKFKANIKNFSSQIKEKLYQFHFKENGELKSPKEIFKDLPFIRLFK
jgi:ubiquinone biosynthesis protein COQ9